MPVLSWSNENEPLVNSPEQSPLQSILLSAIWSVLPPEHIPQSSREAIPKQSPLQSLSLFISWPLLPPEHIPQSSITASPFGTPVQSSHEELSPPQTPHKSNIWPKQSHEPSGNNPSPSK